MADLVGTCPHGFWTRWIAEGDPAGTPWSGQEWAWFTRSPLARIIVPGDRFYVCAFGKLRGWAPVTRVVCSGKLILGGEGLAICRRGDAVACTIEQPIPGFQGLRRVWWSRADEVPFPDWKTP